MKLDFSRNIKSHHMIHYLKNTNFNQSKHMEPDMVKRKASICTIENGGPVIDTILSHQKRGRVFPIFGFLKGDYDYHTVWQTTKYFADNDETVTKVF